MSQQSKIKTLGRYVKMTLILSNIDKTSTWAMGLFSSIFLYLKGNVPEAIWILVAIMLIDIITGFLKGIYQKNLQSRIMAKGIAKKTGIISAILLGFLLDRFLNLGSPLFTNLILGLSVGSEALSILENLDAIGVKIPQAVKDKVLSMTQDNQQDNTKL